MCAGQEKDTGHTVVNKVITAAYKEREDADLRNFPAYFFHELVNRTPEAMSDASDSIGAF